MLLKTRKEKLILLRRYLNLETNELESNNSMDTLYTLYEKILLKKKLDRQISQCSRCKDMNIKSYTGSVPGWGSLNADIFFIGESPCVHSMLSQFPFAWRSGRILDVVLKLSNLNRYDVFVSNSMHCHPESKRAPTDKEIHKCARYLHEELKLVEPKLVVTLGNSAKAALSYIASKHHALEYAVLHNRHPAAFLYNSTGLRDYILKFSLELDKISNANK